MSVGFGFLNEVMRRELPPSIFSTMRVDRNDFFGVERDLFDFLLDHYTTYGLVPNRDVAEAELGTTITQTPINSIDYWADKVRERTKHHLVADGINRVREVFNAGNIDVAIDDIQSLAISLQEIYSGFTNDRAGDLALRVLNRHDEIQGSVGLIGVTFGFPFLDDLTMGAQPGDFIMLVARMGVGKTFVMLAMSLAAYLSGKKVLFVNNEMTNIQCMSRLMALASGVTHRMLRHGRLSEFAKDKLREAVMQFNDDRYSFMQGSLTGSVEDVIVRAKEFRPDIMYVDGAYLLGLKKAARGSSKWEVVMDVATKLKKLCLSMEIPILTTYQQGRKAERRSGGSLETIGYSDAPAQLASIVMDLSDASAEDSSEFVVRMTTQKVLSLLKGREGESGSMTVVYDMQHTRIYQESISIAPN
jgi:replicative DNA helicase